jgi:hypothetical protein
MAIKLTAKREVMIRHRPTIRLIPGLVIALFIIFPEP